ncbi:MAG: hypothetical protein PHU48_03085 [Candidatus Cloacimonetes bacterium]|nr:hypothetical protein [Candidatus Cloacimonadota bacterium]
MTASALTVQVDNCSTKGNQFEGWGGKLCLPQRAELASEGGSAASAKQELGSPFPAHTYSNRKKAILLATY